MNKNDYLKSRAALIAGAQAFINEGKLEDAAAKRAEIEKLDALYQAASTEQANLNAVEGTVNATMQDMDNQITGGESLGKMEATQSNVSYEDVFAKVALHRDLTNEEIAVFNQFNPENVYVHSTQNTEIVIPETVVGGIEDMMEELHPILGDVRTTRIKGTVKYVRHTEIKAGDADYYDEDTPTVAEENAFGQLTLGGKELSKAVTVTWKLQAMAMSDFIPFLQRELGRRMGYAKARAFVKGVGDAKYPEGVITHLLAEAGTPQRVTYAAATGLTYDKLTEAMSKLRSSAMRGAKIYANNGTAWTVLATLKDNDGRPLFVPDVTSGGVGRIFGLPVMEEDALDAGEILIGNMAAGYKENISEPMKLVTEQHAKPRKTDFVGYEVHDGGVSDAKAFAYIVKGV